MNRHYSINVTHPFRTQTQLSIDSVCQSLKGWSTNALISNCLSPKKRLRWNCYISGLYLHHTSFELAAGRHGVGEGGILCRTCKLNRILCDREYMVTASLIDRFTTGTYCMALFFGCPQCLDPSCSRMWCGTSARRSCQAQQGLRPPILRAANWIRLELPALARATQIGLILRFVTCRRL